MNAVKLVSSILVLVGALNWGLWGLFQFDVVAQIFGGNSTIPSRVIYTLVGIAAVVKALTFADDFRNERSKGLRPLSQRAA